MKSKRHRIHNKIHRSLKRHAPKSLEKIKKIFTPKYPKLAMLGLTIVIAYYIFSQPLIQNKIVGLDNLNYLGIFIAGLFFTFGFSTPFSVGFFVVSQPQNIYLAAIIGGVGATLGDLLIYKLVKFSFLDEFNKIKKGKIINEISKITKNHLPTIIRHYMLYIFAGIIISSPLPDEFGVSMLAGLTTINWKKLALIGLLFNTLGIFIMLHI